MDTIFVLINLAVLFTIALHYNRVLESTATIIPGNNWHSEVVYQTQFGHDYVG